MTKRRKAPAKKRAKRAGFASQDDLFVQPNSVYLVGSGRFGYTVEIRERKAAGGTAALSLASVLDLSWSHASELRDLLSEFMVKLPLIKLDSKTELQRQIQQQQQRIRSLRGEIVKAETRIKDLEECERTAE